MFNFRIFQISFLILHLFSAHAYSQKTEKLQEWIKIQPLVSTKADVEKIFGKTVSNQYHTEYKIADTTVSINYSSENCKSKDGIFDVSVGTVTLVQYFIANNRLKLKDLRLDLKKYRLEVKGDVEDHLTYSNYDEGISFTFDRRSKSVGVITLTATKKDYEKYSCKG